MTLQELHEKIQTHFNISELRTLCFKLNINYEVLSGNNLPDLVLALIQYCQRHNRLDDLVNLCATLRPNTSWDIVSNQSSKQTNLIDSKPKSSVILVAILVVFFLVGAFGAWERIKGLVQNNTEPTSVAVMESVTSLPIPTDAPTLILPTTTPLPEAVNVVTTPTVLAPVKPTPQPEPSPTHAAIYTPTMETVNGYTYVLIPAKSSHEQTNEVNEFWIGAYEVTNLWFAIYLNSINSNNQCSNGSMCFDAQSPTARIRRQNNQWVVDEGYENHPVTDVTWHGASDYCQAIEGRLPTLDEWIHAASWNPITNDVMPYPWGSALPSSEYANYNNHINDTQPVGSYPSGRTLLGAYDMLGNVWEFIANTRGINRTALGGGWDTSQNQLIIGTSYPANENTTSSNLGFRCSR